MRAVTLFVVAHLLAGLAGLSGRTPEGRESAAGFPGWPTELDGRALTPLPLTAREAALAEDFPGKVGRFVDESGVELVLRWVRTPTRRLHPVADCLRASGWTVTPAPVRLDATGRQWGASRATRGDAVLEITERIADGSGQCWPDASSWYWAALLSRTRGPWWAISAARRSR